MYILYARYHMQSGSFSFFMLGSCSCYCIITRRCAAAQLSHPKKAEDGSHCLSDMIWFAGWGIDI